MSSIQSSISTLFKSKDFWAINKISGHHWDDVITHCEANWEPAHRLDYGTSGILLLCRPNKAQSHRKAIFNSEYTKKIYIAGASSRLSKQYLDQKIHGFVASRYRSSKKVRFAQNQDDLSNFRKAQSVCHEINRISADDIKCSFQGHLYKIRLITGARHQIRSFFSWADAPLLGDKTYEGKSSKRLELHAWQLEFRHPDNPKELIKIEAPLP